MTLVLVCIRGSGHVEHNDIHYAVGQGDELRLPTEIGVCAFLPAVEVTLLEIVIPMERAIDDHAPTENLIATPGDSEMDTE